MKRKEIKGIVILLVIAIITLSTNVYAFASEEIDMNTYQNFFEAMGYKTYAKMEANSTQEDFDIINQNGLLGNISKEILPNGDVKCIITEENLKNEMIIKPDGKMYIDGSLITVENENGRIAPLLVDYSIFVPSIQAMRAHRHEFKDECPYGKPTDYTNSVTTKKVVSLGEKTFKTITEYAWGTIVTTLMGISGLVSGVLGGLGVSIALQYLKEYRPQYNACSLKYTRSVHKDKGFTVTDSMSVAKYTTTYYANDDYTGIIKDSSGKSSYSSYEVFTY